MKQKIQKKNKLNIKFVLILVIVVGVIAVAIYSITKNVKNTVNDDGNILIVDEGSLIDGNNLENAEIVDHKKVNNSEIAHEVKTIDGLEFSDLELDSTDSETSFSVQITNNSGSKISQELYFIVVLDKEGNEIVKLPIVTPNLEAGASGRSRSEESEDYINMYDYRIEK